ncbi:neuronal acetylcholine receptor subunit alpha-7-like [Crassostrea angulata]|uniref:neuronal acetylcholine receptor subunit alpha-7-like n=1 Tax=Magallana angulata TaxID=2784310 RepID=UPI0022B1D2F9|nr:neuronal acetylcholine receptor subunit alpha-7-like [Crassostrea angulata]
MVLHLFTTLEIVLLVLSSAPEARSQENETIGIENNLQETLFKTYNRYTKPVKVYPSKLPLGIRLYLLSLQELNMKMQTLHTATFLEVMWTDEYLTWNLSDFSNIQYLRLPADKVWVPSICNIQEISGKRCLTYGSVADTSSEVLVNSFGKVVLGEAIKSTILCNFNAQKFPFDSQTCNFEFFSYYNYFFGTDIDINQSMFQDEYFAENEEWDLVSSSTKISKMGYDNMIIMSVVLRRKPLFPTLTLVVPIIALSIMNVFCSVLPIESGEKVGMSMALFLTFAVFGSILSDEMPKNSRNISWFMVYVTIQIIVSGLNVVVETIVLRLYYLEMRNMTMDPVLVEMASDTVTSMETSYNKLKMKTDSIDRTRTHLTRKWKNWAKRLDRGFMILNICTSVISFCVCASMIMMN